ncbi:alpha/beta fold hydrolase [Micromonospora sp. KC723]|uniref:alpha/beta fold hydrolase n=1 Tax=Micromonospora sp. KC723 TaxID=2530381 RepID=UPI001FB732B1|nr:alpha/beta hydrolase [Micromonospora sp. KC723]
MYATLCHSVRNPVEEDLAQVAAPTLVVAGSRDPVVPPAWRCQVTRLVPDARQVDVPGAAHNVATTAPRQVADAIRALLSPNPEMVVPCASATRRSGPPEAASAAS